MFMETCDCDWCCDIERKHPHLMQIVNLAMSSFNITTPIAIVGFDIHTFTRLICYCPFDRRKQRFWKIKRKPNIYFKKYLLDCM